MVSGYPGCDLREHPNRLRKQGCGWSIVLVRKCTACAQMKMCFEGCCRDSDAQWVVLLRRVALPESGREEMKMEGSACLRRKL